MRDGKVGFRDYAHSKELVILFVYQSRKQTMNVARFSMEHVFDIIFNPRLQEIFEKYLADYCSTTDKDDKQAKGQAFVAPLEGFCLNIVLLSVAMSSSLNIHKRKYYL